MHRPWLTLLDQKQILWIGLQSQKEYLVVIKLMPHIRSRLLMIHTLVNKNIAPNSGSYAESQEMAASADDTPVRFSPYGQRTVDDTSIVNIDHNYAKPWSTHPDASNAQPLRRLFMEPRPQLSCQLDKDDEDSELIDVEGDIDNKAPLYDEARARSLMMEGERLGAELFSDQLEQKEDWEEHITTLRNSWTVPQNRIFAKVMRILQADRLARLTIQRTKNEPIQRRLQIDKASKRVRQAFANAGWDMKLLHWLHNMFLENLQGQLLVSYLEILQTLRTKVPSLTEKLIAGTTIKPDLLSSEALSGFFKKTWDPVVASISQQKLKKLPENPLLLIIPSAPMVTPNPLASKRHRFWHSQLSSMGKVINVTPINTNTKITIANCVEGMLASVRSKILEVKSHHPGRPIVLIGWEVGAVIACQVAQMELVQAVICLGYPTTGISGHRWEIDDQIYACKTPTLFVVGQHASNNSLDMLEEIREKIRIETGLVVVGGADSQLRMCRAKKKSSSVTQAVVDRCILEEVFDFLGRIMSQVNVHPDLLEDIEVKKPRKRKQKEFLVSDDVQISVKKPSLKVPKTFTLTGSSAALLTGQAALTGNVKIGKKTLAKKRASKIGDVYGKKQVLQLNLSVPIKTSEDQPLTTSKSSTTEAAAIASAPELSNLLQSIKTTQPTNLGTMKVSMSLSASTSSSLPTTSIATTTALTLSRFLASSGLLKNTMSFKPEDDMGLAIISDGTESDSGLPGSKDSSPAKQQPQILIRANTSSEAFPMPYFPVGGKSSKSSSTGKITGSPSSGTGMIPSTASSQIHQLLLASSTSLLTGSSVPVTTQARTLPSLLLTPSPGQLKSPSPSTLSPSLTFVPVSPSKANTSVRDSLLHSPGASVINIGSDTVFMKESPRTSSPAPGTVSIDLGQIASSSASSILKLSPAPKVSLIPMNKSLQSMASDLSSVQTSHGSRSSSPATSLIQVSSLTQTSPSSTIQTARTLQMITTSKTLSTLTVPSVSTESSPTSSPQMRRSTLPSNMITLQLSPQKTSSSPSNIITLAKSNPHDVGSAPSGTSSNTIKTQLKLNTTTSGSHKVQSASSVLSGLRASDSGEAKTQPTLSKFTTDLASLMMNSGSHSSSSSQLVFQCKSSLSSSSSSSTPLSSKPVTSEGSTVPQVVMVSSSEPLGKVTSLLESSPVITGKTISSLSPSTTWSSVVTSSSPSVKESGKKSTTSTLSSPSVSSTGSSAPGTPSTGGQHSASPSTTASPSTQGSTKASKTTIASYTATSKPVLPTIASTRTRRIKTPKQYDL